jgi:hypothetical protein
MGISVFNKDLDFYFTKIIDRRYFKYCMRKLDGVLSN